MEKESEKESPLAKNSEGKQKKEFNLEILKQNLKECEKLKREYLAGWKRARADLLNYKKGELKRVEEIVKYADVALILKILPILDNFNLAEEKLPGDLKHNENVKGLLQIKAQLQDFLKAQGVEEIEAIGKKFDPNLHEVVEEVEAKGKELGTVIEEVQKGYKIYGKLLRPTKVKIAK